jgi:putative tricarboxylic transport membrane protein
MIDALFTVLGLEYLLYILIGVVIGIATGCLPGFTATMGTALLLPFTFTLEPGIAIGMLGALYVAAMYSDAIPACLVNTPGTPSAMATAFDGFPMTKRGEGQSVLTAAAYASMIGAVVGGFMFLYLAPPLSTAALRFGPPEFFWIGVFAITIIGSIAGDSLLKGIAGGAIGMLVSTVGLATTGAVTRFTFGVPGLSGGVAIVAALIGIFAIPQVLSMVAKRRTEAHIAEVVPKKGVVKSTVGTIMRRPGNVVRSSLVGTFIGIIPGAGSPVASLVSYNESKRWSRERGEYGKGSVHGVVASETANSAAAGGAMVPLIALGVPGSAPAAIILGALLLQGLRPGPTMFRDTPELVYGFAWSFVIAGIVTFLVGSVTARYLAQMVKVPVRILVPAIVMLTIVGAYAIRTNVYDVYVMAGLGLFVYLLTRIGFHPGPIGLGLILGPIVEPALVQSIALSRASSWQEVFFGRPLSIVLILMVLGSIGWVAFSNYQRYRERKQLPNDEAEAIAGTTVSELMIAGVLLIAIAAVFYSQTGERVQDWILPWIVIAVLAFLGVIMIVRSLGGSGGRRVAVIPAILRGHGIDVMVVATALVVTVAALRTVGFWISCLIMMIGVSAYLTSGRTRKALTVSTVAVALLVLAMSLLMSRLFHVPVPSTFFL